MVETGAEDKVCGISIVFAKELATVLLQSIGQSRQAVLKWSSGVVCIIVSILFLCMRICLVCLPQTCNVPAQAPKKVT